MSVKNLLLGISLSIVLGGCTYHPASIEPVPGIIIDDDIWYGRDHDDWEDRKEWEEDRREWEKDREERRREWEKDRREWEKERRERERERWD